jgi:putative NIF3 family GTP cyclohydrolase 1 type 2
MTLQQIYDLSIEMGMKADPRGEAAVRKLLQKNKKDFEDLSEKNKKYFDRESLTNPYSDTRILFGDLKTNVKKIIVGIDTDAAEILLADRLNQKGAKIDAVVGHHPIGISLAALHDVMDLQVDAYAQVGVPVNVLDSLMGERSENIKRKIHPSNHNQVVDTARLLEMPLMNLHTVWDNIGDAFMKKYIEKRKFENVGEIVDYLMELPEYVEAKKGKNGPEIVSGSAKSRPGKVAIFFTGGTNPSKEVYEELAKAGIGTLIDMHIPEEGLKELKKLHVNVINAGHMASDSIGANIFLDALEKKGVEAIVAGGLLRIKRNR